MRETLVLSDARTLRAGVFRSAEKIITTQPWFITVECHFDMRSLPQKMERGIPLVGFVDVDLALSLEINTGRGWAIMIGSTSQKWDNSQPRLEQRKGAQSDMRGYKIRAVLDTKRPITLIAPGLTVEFDESPVRVML